MKRFKLTKHEQQLEDAAERGEFQPLRGEEYDRIVGILRDHSRKKDAVLNLRVNSDDLRRIKQRAKKIGVKYQTFISEMIHRLAEGPDKRVRSGRVV